MTNGHKLTPTTTADLLVPVVKEALSACKRALPNDAQDRINVIISLSDDYEIVLGRLIADAFVEEFPNVLPVLRQTNALLVENAILTRQTHFGVTGGGTHANVLARESFGFHYDCCLYEKDKTGSHALTLSEYLSRPHVAVHYGSALGVADGFLQRIGEERRLVLMTSHYSALPQYLLNSDRVALVPVVVARYFVSLFPSLMYCAIPFVTVNDPVELSYRSDLFDDPVMKRCAAILRRCLQQVDWSAPPDYEEPKCLLM